MQGAKPMNGGSDWLAWAGNSASVLTVFGTILGFLPPLAALVAVIWYLIQIAESKTYRDWRMDRQRVKKERKIARLKAKQVIIEAELDALAVRTMAKDFADHMIANAEGVAANKVAAAKEEVLKSTRSE